MLKKEREPDVYMSEINLPVMNYKVYYMKKWEKLLYFIVAFLFGAAVGYLFYGGIGKDAYGDPTTLTYVLNVLFMLIGGIFAGVAFIPIRTKQIIAKRKRALRDQFRSMLEALSTSLGAGKNVNDSFIAVYNDLQMQYDSEAYIIYELYVIISSVQNNVPIEKVIADFGRRSDIEDIEDFANIFAISYRKGGNMNQIIKNTHEIMSDKMEIEDEIATIVSGSKNEQTIMLFMPVLLIAMIKMMSSEMAANFTTKTGVIATTVGVVMFIVSYFVGKKVLDIKV